MFNWVPLTSSSQKLQLFLFITIEEYAHIQCVRGNLISFNTVYSIYGYCDITLGELIWGGKRVTTMRHIVHWCVSHLSVKCFCGRSLYSLVPPRSSAKSALSCGVCACVVCVCTCRELVRNIEDCSVTIIQWVFHKTTMCAFVK